MDLTAQRFASSTNSTIVRVLSRLGQRLMPPQRDSDLAPLALDRHDPIPVARDFVTAQGMALRLRPLQTGDRAALERFFAELSDRSRRQRFLVSRPALCGRELDVLLSLRRGMHWSWVAEYHTPDRTGLAGVAQGCRDADASDSAEIAVAVLDRFQGQGIGRALLAAVAAEAMAVGITRLHGHTLADNRRILGYAEHRQAAMEFATEGCVEVRFSAPQLARDLPPESGVPAAATD